LTEQQKKNKIEVINQQLASLGEQITNTNAEAQKHVEKRNKLNEQFKKLRLDIRELKNERDNLNEKVKTLKQQRDEVRAKIRASIDELKVHSQKITELKKKTPRVGRRGMQRELEDIEWKIQTTTLDMREEKRLVENVKQLETHLNIYKKIDVHAKKIAELRKELKSLEAAAESAHQELTKMAERSQYIHAKMIGKITESKKIKDEADSLHSAYVQAKEQTKPLHEEFKRLLENRKKLQDAMREEDKRRKKKTEKILKEKLEIQARKKLQRGEKLSLDEFKLLAEDETESV
jgi:uncharacterized coiled-coil DUF342 family protein